MSTKTGIRLAAYAVILAYAIAIALSGVRLPGLTIKILGFLPLALTTLFAIFDRWVWRWPYIILEGRRPVRQHRGGRSWDEGSGHGPDATESVRQPPLIKDVICVLRRGWSRHGVSHPTLEVSSRGQCARGLR